MHTNQQLRESLILQAESAYISLMEQIDNLLSVVGFYLDRYPIVTPGDDIRTKELVQTITLLTKLNLELAETFSRIKSGERRIINPVGIELLILNEIWANIQALVYFVKSQEMSLDPFEYEQTAVHFATLVRANRLLT
jgi:hypothetical protein